jgi:hypothetical protein
MSFENFAYKLDLLSTKPKLLLSKEEFISSKFSRFLTFLFFIYASYITYVEINSRVKHDTFNIIQV